MATGDAGSNYICYINIKEEIVKLKSACALYGSKWELDGALPINESLDLKNYISRGLDIYTVRERGGLWLHFLVLCAWRVKTVVLRAV